MMTLEEINGLNFDILTVNEVRQLCKKHNVCVFVHAGKLIRFEPANAEF